MNKLDPRNAMMQESEAAIRNFLKEISEKNTFSGRGITQRQEAIRQLLAEQGWSRKQLSAALHQDWSTIDGDMRSAACLYEQYRMRLVSSTMILPYLLAIEGPAFHVSLASPRWRRERDQLDTISSATLQRKVRDGIGKLREFGCEPVVCGALELSAGIECDGSFVWEPHLDFVVVGASREQIRAAFAVLTTSVERRQKWLRIDQANDDIAGYLDYGIKVQPELRRAYIGESGRQQRGHDHLRGQELGMWLEWMGSRPMADLVFHHGLPRRLATAIHTAELATLVEEIV